MAEKGARKPRVCLWGTSGQVGTNLNAILRGRLFDQMLHRPLIFIGLYIHAGAFNLVNIFDNLLLNTIVVA